LFGIGLGEIILIVFIVFLISPRDIPKVLRKIGQLFGALRKLRDEVADIENEVKDVAAEIRETGRMIKRPTAPARGPAAADAGAPAVVPVTRPPDPPIGTDRKRKPVRKNGAASKTAAHRNAQAPAHRPQRGKKT
jgi:Sec-independent protein translocase protein TatA